MAKAIVPHFHNTNGVADITIGVKEFMCVGAKPPNDHPHIYLDMGEESEKICPYCSTHFKYDDAISADESSPPGYILMNENV